MMLEILFCALEDVLWKQENQLCAPKYQWFCLQFNHASSGSANHFFPVLYLDLKLDFKESLKLKSFFSQKETPASSINFYMLCEERQQRKKISFSFQYTHKHTHTEV